jgi:hypothetical protein
MNRFILLVSFLLLFQFSSAQDKDKSGARLFGKTMTLANQNSPTGLIKCASTEYEAHLKTIDPNRMTTEEFEAWLAPKMQQYMALRASQGTDNASQVYTLPVVVHVIHSGQTVGTGPNISNARVQSQITVLNQDYRRQVGTPGFNNNAVGADTEIQFCLAQRDPNNQPTNGINRVNLGNTTWSESNIETILKPQTQWDPNRYINIWVCQLGGDLNGVLGYAQFPSGSTLPGIPFSGAANTDGVVIDWRCFGSSAIAPGSYYQGLDRGRTTTHELGHFFGLRHIWGDNNSCTVNASDSFQDFCPDTPPANTENYGCTPNFNCNGQNMIENYMDYSDDICMNIFTQNQKTRMVTTLLNAARRASLTTSNGCQPPQSFGIDGGIEIVNLNVDACGVNLSPVIRITNFGTNTLTSASISYNIDGGIPTTINWNGSLANGQSQNVNIGNITSTAGSHVFNVSIPTLNGQVDQNTVNNTASSPFEIVSSFNTTQVVFRIQRDTFGSETTWSLTNATGGAPLYQGGPYTDTANPPLITQNWTLSANQCYIFTINDAFGDGICCEYGNGFYDLKTPGGGVIAQGGQFTSSETKRFGLQLLSTEDNSFNGNVYLYPNPTKNILNVHMDGHLGLPDQVTIYNTLGQTIFNKVLNNINDLSIDVSSYSNGVYLVKVQKEGQVKTLQFVKN